MFRNVANQIIGAQLLAADGTAVTTGTTNVFVTRDGGAQAAGGNTTATHEGNGFWTYVTTATDTDGDHVAFTFVNSGAANVTVQVYTQNQFASDVLRRAADTMVHGTCGSGSTQTSVVASAITLAGGGSSIGAGDPLAGRRIVFAGNTSTANLRGAAARITSHTSGATPTFTLDANDTLPTSPASGDIFVIV